MIIGIYLFARKFITFYLSSHFNFLLLIFNCSLLIIYCRSIYAHGPDQVDHNFYLSFHQNKLVLRLEIPIGELLGFIQKQKMDIDKNGIISQKEQNDFIKKFTQERLKDITISLNKQENAFSHSHTTIEITTEKVIPSIMMIKIFLEHDLSQDTHTKNFTLYIKDGADKNITQFINLFTENNIQVVNMEKELLFGEERIFNLSFIIPPTNGIIINKNQPQNIPQNTSRLYDKIKTYLTTTNISIKTLILLFCFAIFLGILHALEPGHGKSIMSAYVLATKGAVFDIILLGIIVVITHTTIVFILGLTTLYFSQYVLPQTIYPYLSFLSSLLIILLGLNLIRKNAITNQAHTHIKSIHLTNSYLKDIIQFGISGGLVPCPAAIAILLTSIQFNKITIGIVLIVALSIGIAITLILVGIVAIYTKKFILHNNNHSHSSLQIFLPVLSGIFITMLGTMLLLKTFEELKLFKITL